MAIKKITAKFVETLNPTGKRQEFCDPLTKGFGIRVNKSGKKTFFVRFRYRGKTERHTIGTYPAYSLADARHKAQEILSRAEKGELHNTEDTHLRINEAFDRFIEQYAKVKQKDWRITKSRLKKFLAEYGGMKLTDLHRRDIHNHLDSLIAAGIREITICHDDDRATLGTCCDCLFNTKVIAIAIDIKISTIAVIGEQVALNLGVYKVRK